MGASQKNLNVFGRKLTISGECMFVCLIGNTVICWEEVPGGGVAETAAVS